MRRFSIKAGVLLGSLLIAGCSNLPTEDVPSYGASIGIVNHTGKFIYSASVNGAGGGSVAEENRSLQPNYQLTNMN
ncbi:hypothetical protein [Pseudoduganella sp. HUAS MS19]